MQRFHPHTTGMALGSTLAVGMAFLGLLAMATGYGDTIVSIVSSVYKGYRPSVPGAIIGGIWGFIDGYIGGYIFAWFYNKFAK